MRSLLFGLAVCACLLSCRDTAAGGGQGRQEASGAVDWRREAADLIESGRCDEALAYLNGVRERQPLWFELASQAHMACWKSKGSSAHAAEAVRVIDEGLAKYPHSANLLLSRGYRRQELGERDAALRDFRAAEEQARIALQQAAEGAREPAEAVLQSARKAISAMSDPRIAETVAEQAILARIAAGDCQGALDALRSTQAVVGAERRFYHSFLVNNACLSAKGDPSYRAAAEAALRDGLQHYPSSARLLVASGAWSEAAGRSAEAVAFYERALQSPDLDREMPDGRRAIGEKIDRLKKGG